MWVLEKELLWFLPDCVSSEWILQTEAVEKLTHGQGHASSANVENHSSELVQRQTALDSYFASIIC